MVADQPPLEQLPAEHREAAVKFLRVMLDYGQRIQEHAFNLLEAGGTVADLRGIDDAIAHAVLLMPNLRNVIELKDSPIADYIEPIDGHKVLTNVNFLATIAATVVVFAPVIDLSQMEDEAWRQRSIEQSAL